MDYSNAFQYFITGLEQAKNIADSWYTAWNAFGLGHALRGLARLKDAESYYHEALEAFRKANQPTFVTWVERALQEIGSEVPEESTAEAIRIWLCPMCGSRLQAEQAAVLRKGKMTTCDYCGTTIG
jgi:hypothetical protein